MTIRIGITGPIGCGKTTVARWLGELGARVIDADEVAREATAPGEPALDAVIDRFGERYRRPDGSLDRGMLGRLVFADPAALTALEAIVHPAVRRRIELAVAGSEATGAPAAVVVEAIKLVEGGLADACDEVWLVMCDPERQLERLLARGSDEAEAAQRIAAQDDPARRLRPAATRIIDTSGDIEETRRRVLDAWMASGAG